MDAVEIEPQIHFSGLERETIRMMRFPKAEMLFQIAKSSRGFKESNDGNF